MIKKGENINSPIMVWQGKVRRCTVPSGTVWYCRVRKELIFGYGYNEFNSQNILVKAL